MCIRDRSWLQSHGFALRAHYGILCVCAYLADNERKYDPVFYQQLLTLERAMGQIESYICLLYTSRCV